MKVRGVVVIALKLIRDWINGPQNLAPPSTTNAGLPSSGSENDGFSITTQDVVDTTLDFVPIAGGVKDIYRGLENDDGWQVAMGVGFIILDVATLGGSSLVKGVVKTGAKVGGSVIAKNAAKSSKNVINIAEGGISRIQNAANRINKPIHLVGSRANGTSNAFSDFDYVIEGINSRQWSKIKNSLPGAPSRVDNLPRRIDLFRGPLNPNKPYITIYPN